LVPGLLAEGYSVVAMDLVPGSLLKFEHPRYRFYAVDSGSFEALREAGRARLELGNF
jgi:hypothetical protein